MRTHNMQRNRWPLELPEDATEKTPQGNTQAHAKNAAGTLPPQKKNINKT